MWQSVTRASRPRSPNSSFHPLPPSFPPQHSGRASSHLLYQFSTRLSPILNSQTRGGKDAFLIFRMMSQAKADVLTCPTSLRPSDMQ